MSLSGTQLRQSDETSQPSGQSELQLPEDLLQATNPTAHESAAHDAAQNRHVRALLLLRCSMAASWFSSSRCPTGPGASRGRGGGA